MSKHLSPAYQLYSAREDASNDLEGVLDQLSRMGYEGVEFAGFFERSAKEVRKLLKHTGLKAVSSHVPLQQIRDDMQSVLDYHEELECGCIAVPYLAEEDRPGQPGFARVLETLYTFGRQCKKRGIVLLYHNHDFEFAQISGMTALDFLYAAVPASVLKCELDTCWIRYAGADPADYLRRYAERCPMMARRLPALSVTTFSRVSKLCRNQMTIVARKMTVNARSRKSFAFSHRSSATLLTDGNL